MKNKIERKMNQLPDSISGYVHSVSPIKLSKINSKYFTASLQTDRDTYHHTVIFQCNQQTSWNNAARNCSAIKLMNAKKVPSKYALYILLHFLFVVIFNCDPISYFTFFFPLVAQFFSSQLAIVHLSN